MRRNAKVDENQPEIVDKIRKMGGYVLHIHQLKNAFDILVGYNGRLYIIEIKKDGKSKLTQGELECAYGFESVGVKYHVIYCIEQFLEIIAND